MSVLLFLWSNRKIVGDLLLVGAILFGLWWLHHSGYEQGKQETQVKFDAYVEKQNAISAAQKAQAESDVKIAVDSLQAKLSEIKQVVVKASARFQHEKASNPVYVNCKLPLSGVQYYESIANPGAENPGQQDTVTGLSAPDEATKQ